MRIFPLVFVFFSFAPFAYAAELNLSASEILRVGSSVVITATLDTLDEKINALEGALSYPKEYLMLREIRDGNSVINFWVERPHDAEDAIRFSGITPGGISGEGSEVFTLVFEVARVEDVHFELEHAKAYRNDGEGTEVSLRLNNTIRVQERDVEEDSSLPEPFVISLASDEALFEGQRFIVFATQDKQSGIEHYEVCEGILGRCMRTESPFLLENQKSNSLITVRAYDREGHVRVARLFTPEAKIRYSFYSIFGILMFVSAGAYARRKSAFLA
ncbi:hypothetical protein HY969_03995 [Candidatus Kaiserbacteria bacterium]|nr:hypothetical protein [Candidatus Kaiserbacteria bacterium]